MTQHTMDTEEITEYYPDDPLANVPNTLPSHLSYIKNYPTNSTRCRSKTKIRKIKRKQQSHVECNVCGLTFTNRPSLNMHQKTHNRQQQFECFVCHKSFNRKSNLITHSKGHTNVKPFHCKYCNLSFTRTTELLKHAIFHTGDTRNQCRQCKLVLSSPERLEKHKKTHAVCTNFHCQMCGANGFESKKNFSLHMRLHTNVCDKTMFHDYIDSTTVQIGSDDQLFQCDLCKKPFSRKSNFIAHLKRHNSKQTELDKTKTHLCCICGKLFSFKTHLIRHLYVHNGERPYKCEYCGSDFTHRGGLMQHIKKHKRDK